MSTPTRVPKNLLSQSGDPAGPSLITGDIYYNSTAKTIRIYDGSAWVDLINDETNQTIAGTKTFTADTTVLAPSSTIALAQHIVTPPDATVGSPWKSGEILFNTKYWNGSGSTTETIAVRGEHYLSASGAYKLSVYMEGNEKFYITDQGGVFGLYYEPDGYGGSTASSRWMGATASGAPASGTYSAGDYIIDQSGSIWVCTEAGTPGTWTEIGAGGSSPLTTKGDIHTYSTVDARLAVGTDGLALVANSTTSTGLSWLPRDLSFTWSFPGNLAVQTGRLRQYFELGDWKIVRYRLSANTAPTGSAITVDMNVNGTTIFTTQGNRPTIGSGANTSNNNIHEVTDGAGGDYVTVDIDTVGSTTPGSDLVVQVWVRRID